MSDQIVPFRFDGVDVRTVQIDGEPWWIANDVARALGYSATHAMTRSLDDDERGAQTLRTPSGDQEMTIINEAGIYSAVLRSTVPQAKAFKRWLTHEVLPAIRKTGQYVAPVGLNLETIRQLNAAVGTLLEHNERIVVELAAVKPRAEAWDAIVSAEGDYSVGDAAKILARAGITTGPTRLFRQLQDIRWTYRGSDGRPRAYADRVDKGFLSEKPSFHFHPGTGERVVDPPQIRVTVAGIERLRQRLHVGGLKAVLA